MAFYGILKFSSLQAVRVELYLHLKRVPKVREHHATSLGVYSNVT